MAYRDLQDALGVYERFRFNESASPIAGDNILNGGNALPLGTYNGRTGEADIEYQSDGLVQSDTEGLGIVFGGTPGASTKLNGYFSKIINDDPPAFCSDDFHSVEFTINPTGHETTADDQEALLFGCRNFDDTQVFGTSYLRDGGQESGFIKVHWKRGGTTYKAQTIDPLLTYGDTQHIVLTFSGSATPKIYINGESVAVTTTSTARTSNVSGNISFGSAGANLSILAALDEFTFYTGELEAGDAANLYTQLGVYTANRLKMPGMAYAGGF